MRLSFERSVKVVGWSLAGLACAMLCGPVEASCQNLANSVVYAGVMSIRLGAAADLKVYANAFNGGSHHELDIGANHTIGFLNPGQSFTLAVGTATADVQPDACVVGNLEARFSWYLNSNTCAGSPTGSDVRSIVLNTCGAIQQYWRAQRSLVFTGVGNAASYRISLNANVPRSLKEAAEDGCFRVASSDSASACND
jgi:hypothetical protein